MPQMNHRIPEKNCNQQRKQRQIKIAQIIRSLEAAERSQQ
jgi:hypothetical protein